MVRYLKKKLEEVKPEIPRETLSRSESIIGQASAKESPDIAEEDAVSVDPPISESTPHTPIPEKLIKNSEQKEAVPDEILQKEALLKKKQEFITALNREQLQLEDELNKLSRMRSKLRDEVSDLKEVEESSEEISEEESKKEDVGVLPSTSKDEAPSLKKKLILPTVRLPQLKLPQFNLKWGIGFIVVLIIAATLGYSLSQSSEYEVMIEVHLTSDEPGISKKAAAALMSLVLIGEVIEKIEVLPKDPLERKDIFSSYLAEYQENINVVASDAKDAIQLYVTSLDPHKAALIAKEMIHLYMLNYDLVYRAEHFNKILAQLDEELETLNSSIQAEQTSLRAFEDIDLLQGISSTTKSAVRSLLPIKKAEYELELMEIQQKLNELNEHMRNNTNRQVFSFYLGSQYQNDQNIENFLRTLTKADLELFLLIAERGEADSNVVAKKKGFRQLKTKSNDVIRQAIRQPLDMDSELDMAFVMKTIFLESRAKVLNIAIENLYAHLEPFSFDQGSYDASKQKVAKLQQQYTNLIYKRTQTEKVFSEGGKIDTNTQALPVEAKKNHSFAVNPVYMYGAIGILLLGLALVYYRKRKLKTTTNPNV